MDISNIDDLLTGTKSNIHPETPENQYIEPEHVDENVPENDLSDDYSDEPESTYEDKKPEIKSEKKEIDEYGNEKEPENEAIRDRLARQAKKHQAELDDLRSQLAQQGASSHVQKAAQDFEYNPDESGDWQQQLASFVKQTVNSMSQEKEQERTRSQEAETQRVFESKFRDGMNNFPDFVDVMGQLNFEITNPMTLATRAMDNPAAFLYAAAKRNPEELERISKMRDPYAQMTEIGKLEERMRKNKAATQAPRPLGRNVSDSTAPEPKKESSISGDDLLAKSDARRLNAAKRRNN